MYMHVRWACAGWAWLGDNLSPWPAGLLAHQQLAAREAGGSDRYNCHLCLKPSSLLDPHTPPRSGDVVFTRRTARNALFSSASTLSIQYITSANMAEEQQQEIPVVAEQQPSADLGVDAVPAEQPAAVEAEAVPAAADGAEDAAAAEAAAEPAQGNKREREEGDGADEEEPSSKRAANAAAEAEVCSLACGRTVCCVGGALAAGIVIHAVSADGLFLLWLPLFLDIIHEHNNREQLLLR